MTFKASNLEELILPLRIQIGDTSATPTYSDETLHLTLKSSVSALMRRWNDKYYIDSDGVAHRNPYETFAFSSPPVIQYRDHRPIILQASIMIKGGMKYSESGNAVNWKDEEISYSNVEAARQRSSTLQDDVTELNALLPVKLAGVSYGRLYGWKHEWE